MGSKGKSDDTASNVGRGTIYVTNASDGSGSAAITPASISAGSTQDIDIVFTAAGNMDGGKVSFTAPAGWWPSVKHLVRLVMQPPASTQILPQLPRSVMAPWLVVYLRSLLL